MLDAYIIQKIKREKEAESAGVPVHIEIPIYPSQSEERELDEETDNRDDRGVVIIDYTV